MSKILASASEATYLAEAKLCQLLCRTHHENKSAAENSVEHGGGITGKKNCLCDLCRPLKNAYARKFKQAKRDKAKQAPVAEMD